jgi:hypothetical protein
MKAVYLLFSSALLIKKCFYPPGSSSPVGSNISSKNILRSHSFIIIYLTKTKIRSVLRTWAQPISRRLSKENVNPRKKKSLFKRYDSSSTVRQRDAIKIYRKTINSLLSLLSRSQILLGGLIIRKDLEETDLDHFAGGTDVR